MIGCILIKLLSVNGTSLINTQFIQIYLILHKQADNQCLDENASTI